MLPLPRPVAIRPGQMTPPPPTLLMPHRLCQPTLPKWHGRKMGTSHWEAQWASCRSSPSLDRESITMRSSRSGPLLVRNHSRMSLSWFSNISWRRGRGSSASGCILAAPSRVGPMRYRVLFFPYNMFHMYISTDNIVYFSTWYAFPVSPVHGEHYYS